MSRRPPAPPPGYERFDIGAASVVAMDEAASAVRAAMGDGRTLHAWAATVPGATPFTGRATAWGVRLPESSIDVVVRHSRRGGAFAGWLGDRFVRPGRAPRELTAARRLAAAGVPTPQLVAYAIYPAGPGLCRSDVVTRRLPDGQDLPATWAVVDATEREALLHATAALLHALERAGAQHPDLNARNIHLSRVDDAWHAHVLDVDRVHFVPVGDPSTRARNLARLLRSLGRWRDRHALAVTDDHLARLTALAGGAA